jgi:FHA domain.
MIKKLWYDFIGKSETEKIVTHDNMVDAKKELHDAIVRYFLQYFLGHKKFTDTIVIWISDTQQEYQNYIRSDEMGFKNDLCVELDNRQLYAISKANIEFKTKTPPQEFTKILDGVYIQLIAKNKDVEEQEEVFYQAKITNVKGKGSLEKNKYLLDVNKQIEYNIGRGEGSGNHIIIKENDSANNEINSRVSRQHAKIVFVVGKGFYLQTCNPENRTIVNRKNQRVYDLTDLEKRVLLQNNDEIELGKSVCLKFEIIDNNTELK